MQIADQVNNNKCCAACQWAQETHGQSNFSWRRLENADHSLMRWMIVHLSPSRHSPLSWLPSVGRCHITIGTVVKSCIAGTYRLCGELVVSTPPERSWNLNEVHSSHPSSWIRISISVLCSWKRGVFFVDGGAFRISFVFDSSYGKSQRRGLFFYTGHVLIEPLNHIMSAWVVTTRKEWCPQFLGTITIR